MWLFGTVLERPSPGAGLRSKHCAWRWDGSGWREIPFPENQLTADAVVLAPDDVWIVGYDRESLHWDGTGWRTVAMPAVAVAISAVAADDIWAVGRRDTPGGRQLAQPAAMRWNGRSWRLVPTPEFRFDAFVPEPSAGLLDVVALAANDAWAFGEQTFDHGEMDTDPPDPPAILLHWNGTRWTRQSQVPRFGSCGCRPLSPDGKGGIALVRNTAWTRSADGRFVKPAAPPTFTGLAGRTNLVLNDVTNVPGTSRLWGVGKIGHYEGGHYWGRLAIVRYR